MAECQWKASHAQGGHPQVETRRCGNKHGFSSFHLNRGFASAESVGEIRYQAAYGATEGPPEVNCPRHAKLCKP
ncbi:unnamed protein product [Clavelina lepadiformis]|uniref:Uncharacterized protein n=1 Tax=Clavelina lepadiformis TaxID=159417 RepID=A0ABP0H250_CLALP